MAKPSAKANGKANGRKPKNEDGKADLLREAFAEHFGLEGAEDIGLFVVTLERVSDSGEGTVLSSVWSDGSIWYLEAIAREGLRILETQPRSQE